MQGLVTALFFLDAARNILDSQNVARHRGFARLTRTAQYRYHLDPQQLPTARRGDEVGDRRLAVNQALMNDFTRMLDLALLKDGEDRTPEANQRAARHRRRPLGKSLELQPCAIVVEEDASIEV